MGHPSDPDGLFDREKKYHAEDVVKARPGSDDLHAGLGKVGGGTASVLDGVGQSAGFQALDKMDAQTGLFGGANRGPAC